MAGRDTISCSFSMFEGLGTAITLPEDVHGR